MPASIREFGRGFRVLIAFGFRAAPWRAAAFLACGAAMALLSPLVALGAKELVDAAATANVGRGIVAAAALVLTAGGGLAIVLYYVDSLFAVVERAGLVADRRLMALMGGLPGLAHHEQPEYLDQLQLLREERSKLAWMTNATAGLLRVAVQLAASAVLLATVQPLLLLLPLVSVLSFLAGRRAEVLATRAREETVEAERLRLHLFQAALSAASGKEARLFGQEADMRRRRGAAAAAISTARDRADWQGAALRAADAAIFGLAYAGAIGLAIVQAARGRATPGDVVLTIGLAAGMNSIVSTAVGYGTHFLTVLKTAGRYLWLEDYAQAAAPALADPLAPPAVLRQGIAVRDVSFRYPGTARPILDHISLDLPAGHVVALVGENGAGKTTLTKLLCRFYEPEGGAVIADEVDIRRFPIADWQARLSATFQDFVRFELLLRENVGLGDLPRLAEALAINAALARAGAEGLPGELPLGVETQLGAAWPGGVDLSGGQWQRLALARGLLRTSPLLTIFDEPTAALDAPTEHALFARFAAAAHRNTRSGMVTLLVSHRFSTVRMADLIVVLDGGRIVEQGNHDQLMRQGGLYATLYERQSRAYR